MSGGWYEATGAGPKTIAGAVLQSTTTNTFTTWNGGIHDSDGAIDFRVNLTGREQLPIYPPPGFDKMITTQGACPACMTVLIQLSHDDRLPACPACHWPEPNEEDLPAYEDAIEGFEDFVEIMSARQKRGKGVRGVNAMFTILDEATRMESWPVTP